MTDKWVINLTDFLYFWLGKWDPKTDKDCQRRDLRMQNVEKQQTGDIRQKTVQPPVTFTCPIKGLFLVHKKLTDN